MVEKIQKAENVFHKSLFSDHVAIVTGGGSGIGKETALSICRLGGKVAICGRNSEKLIATKEEFKSEGFDIFAEPCDTRDYDKVEEFVKRVLKKFGGRIDVLVNNAGGQFVTAAENLSAKGFEAVVRNNLLGTWNFTHAVATLAMIPQGSGKIVNVTAEVSKGFPGMVHTGAARSGVEVNYLLHIDTSKYLSINKEWGSKGIIINSVAPGVIISSGTDRYPPELLTAWLDKTPLKRHGSTEEIAILICFLASNLASNYLTGQTITSCGGASLGNDWNREQSIVSPKL